MFFHLNIICGFKAIIHPNEFWLVGSIGSLEIQFNFGYERYTKFLEKILQVITALNIYLAY